MKRSHPALLGLNQSLGLESSCQVFMQYVHVVSLSVVVSFFRVFEQLRS